MQLEYLFIFNPKLMENGFKSLHFRPWQTKNGRKKKTLALIKILWYSSSIHPTRKDFVSLCTFYHSFWFVDIVRQLPETCRV